MYKRQAALSLFFIVVALVGTAVIANIDPFNTGEVWVNWTPLAIMAIIGTFGSLLTYTLADEDNDTTDGQYFAILAGITALYGVFGAMFTGMVMTGVESRYTSLVWGSFAICPACYLVAGLITYLAMPDTAKVARRNLRAA